MSVPGMWADFRRDGFDEAGAAAPGAGLVRMMPQGTTTTFSDNLTSDVISVKIDRQADTQGGTPVGTMTFTTKNTDGKYNPDNTASPFYGFLNPGLPIWFGCNDDLTVDPPASGVSGRFAGYLRTLAPIPAAGATDAPTVDWVVDDAMARYRDAKARVGFSTTRTVKSYREALLAAIGETRLDLATEGDTLAASGGIGIISGRVRTRTRQIVRDNVVVLAAQQVAQKAVATALSVLEDLNRLVGTRHFIAPADDLDDWYNYSTRNRAYKLGSAADAALVAIVSDTAGYVHSLDGIENAMSVEVRPFRIADQPSQVWEYGELPFSVTAAAGREIIADFGDQVFDAAVTVSSTNSLAGASMVAYGDGAAIIVTASGSDTVTGLSIDGRPVTRLDSFTVEKSDTGSQLAYGEMQGPNVSSDLVTSGGLAESIATYHIWANASPRKTPSVVIFNNPATLLGLDLFDVVTLTIAQLDVSAKRFGIVGIHEEWSIAAADTQLVKFTLDLRQTPNATALSLLTFGTSTYGGSDIFAP